MRLVQCYRSCVCTHPQSSWAGTLIQNHTTRQITFRKWGSSHFLSLYLQFLKWCSGHFHSTCSGNVTLIINADKTEALKGVCWDAAPLLYSLLPVSFLFGVKNMLLVVSASWFTHFYGKCTHLSLFRCFCLKGQEPKYLECFNINLHCAWHFHLSHGNREVALIYKPLYNYDLWTAPWRMQWCIFYRLLLVDFDLAAPHSYQNFSEVTAELSPAITLCCKG